MLLFVACITTLLYYWSFAFAHLFGVAGVQELQEFRHYHE